MFAVRLAALLVGLSPGSASQPAPNPSVTWTLEARLFNNDLAPAEPVALELTLRQPAGAAASRPATAPGAASRTLPRRWRARLIRTGQIVGEFPLFPVDPARGKDAPLSSTRTFLGIMTRRAGKPSSHFYLDSPGQYSLVVFDPADRDRPPSETLPLRIRDPVGQEAEACNLYRAITPAEAIAALIDQEGTPRTWASLRDLARKHPSTPCGRYAGAASALHDFRQAFASHNNKGGANVWYPVACELRQACRPLEAGHPLRGAVLMHLARACAWAGQWDEARATARTLMETAGRDDLRIEGQRLLDELARQPSRPSRTQAPP